MEGVDRPTFATFLSHSYASTDINLYFWSLMAEAADVQFEVDVGAFPTSTTRLERMIRSADSFIGIYPLPVAWSDDVDRPKLLEESRYFRLELEMAIRARKPSIIFFDRRYARTFPLPSNTSGCSYDVQEVMGRSPSPSRDRIQSTFLAFCAQVAAARSIRTIEGADTVENGLVGVLMPPGAGTPDPGRALVSALGELPIDPLHLRWPPVLDLALLREVRRCDWVVVETSGPEGTAALGLLRGQGIPVLRTRYVPVGEGQAALSPAEEMLFGGFEVGYRKDVIEWSTIDDLTGRVRARATVVHTPRRRIQGADGARAYFQAAAQRREPVFLSYAQEDEGVAKELSAALRQRFASVFDYRATDALSAGRPWLDQLHNEMAEAVIGVALLSPSYVASPYCMDEARTLTDAALARGLRLYPVKVGEVDVPDFLKSIQYFRLHERRPEAIVAKIAEDLGPA